jgi:fatty-acid peroxygenase
MPTHRAPEASIALLRHGFRWSDRIRSELPEGGDPDAVPARMLGRPAIVLRGPDGVRAFTDTELVRRRGAIPGAVGNVLFGRGAVHGLDDAEHVRRKALFVRATTPDSVRSLVDEVELRWLAASRSWRPGREVAVEEEAVRVIGRAVLHWAGIQCPAEEADRVARRMAAIVDGFGVVGPANLEARWSRRRSDAWAARVIHCARRGEPAPRRGSLLELVAWWRDADGHLLPVRTAAVELQNVLRPTIAVARLVGFGARELVLARDWRARLRAERQECGPCSGPGRLALAFAQEVRRTSPFVPVLAAVARREFTLHDEVVPEGATVLLDVVGTLRDRRFWPHPRRFDPERFLGGQEVVADAFVPQGGGEVATGHRCPGEDVALGILAVSCSVLASADWFVPAQDLDISQDRVPTRPASGVRLVARSSRAPRSAVHPTGRR